MSSNLQFHQLTILQQEHVMLCPQSSHVTLISTLLPTIWRKFQFTFHPTPRTATCETDLHTCISMNNTILTLCQRSIIIIPPYPYNFHFLHSDHPPHSVRLYLEWIVLSGIQLKNFHRKYTDLRKICFVRSCYKKDILFFLV